MRFIASTSRVLGTALFAIVFALVLMLILLSDGRVLDPRIGTASDEPALLGVSLLCWVILVAFGVQLTVGRWKHHRDLKRAVLTGLLSLPLLMAIFSLLPEATPDWMGAILAGLSALAACLVADRVLPHRARTE